MRTSKELSVDLSMLYKCELSECPICNSPLSKCNYRSGRKVVQTLDEVLRVGYQPYRCLNPDCANYGTSIGSARWLQLAPLYCTYGFDVIAQIGWLRQTGRMPFEQIHAELEAQVQLSESQVRHLYYERYLPLLACHEREAMEQLQAVSATKGLLLTLDGLAPQGGEPQLWLIRELQTGLTLRSGWLSAQDQGTFVNFIKPIADFNLSVLAILSDKQRGLLPAIGTVFPNSKHAFCQSHYLKNLAEPIATVDEQLKVRMRKTIRKEVGTLIRQEQVENPGVLTVTGLIPSPLCEAETEIKISAGADEAPQRSASEAASLSAAAETSADVSACEADISGPPFQLARRTFRGRRFSLRGGHCGAAVSACEADISACEAAVSACEADVSASDTATCAFASASISESLLSESIEKERGEIILDLTRRVRYLLTLKGRPPFRLAGLEMFERLTEVVECIELMVEHTPDTRLVELCDGIKQGLEEVASEMRELSIAAGWLRDISDLLDPEGKAERTGSEVRQQLFDYLSGIGALNQSQTLDQIAKDLEKTTLNYSAGLFVSYDIAGLPRTNNERESEFRLLNSRLLRTTGQTGATKRLIQRVGAWELLPCPSSFNETVIALSQVYHYEFQKERTRLRTHRARFRLHTRSAKRARQQLLSLAERWMNLPPTSG